MLSSAKEIRELIISAAGSDYKIDLLAVAACVMVVLLSCFGIYRSVLKISVPEIKEVQEINTAVIGNALPENATEHDAKEICKKITEETEEKAPVYHYYTMTEAEADEKAQARAKEQAADVVIKKTAESNIGSQVKVVESSYYAINMEKKHSVNLGAAHIAGKNYAVASYRNRNLEYSVFGSRGNEIGVGISCSIARW